MQVSLSARAARASARRPKRVIALWVLFVVVVAAAGILAGTQGQTDVEQATGESQRYERILDDARFTDRATEHVLIRSTGAVTADDPRFAEAVETVAATLEGTRHVHAVSPGPISADRRAALIDIELTGDPDTAGERVQPSLDAVARVQEKLPDGFTVEQSGGASIENAINDIVATDLQKAEMLSLPLTFLIMLLAFGAFVAAGVPVLLGLTSVLSAIGASALLSHVVHASESTASVIALMGMAVGVDYSLFYLKRVREEEAAGHPPHVALMRAAATSGQAIVVSGATVFVACAGLLLSGSSIFVSLGAGAMIVVLIAVIGSLTVLPAVLAWLGTRVDRGVIAVLAAAVGRAFRWQPAFLVRAKHRPTLLMRHRSRRAASGDGSRAWNAILGAVLRRPAIAAVASAAVLVALAAPALGMKTGQPALDAFPDVPETVAWKHLQESFPGEPSPAEVIVAARDARSPQLRAAIAKAGGRDAEVNPAGTVVRFDVPIPGDGFDEASFAATRELRERTVPAALAGVPGVQTWAVGGDAADTMDFNATMSDRLPIVLLFVLGLAFLLLLCAFRSPVVAVVSVGLNLLSVGAAYGVLTLVFQHGWFKGLLGFESAGTVVNWIPLFLFVILFGLSMDYHVFILSRIRELAARGVGTEEAVRRGIRDSAGTVTYAALVMVTVFAVFASLRMLEMKQMGVGLAAAVLIDATIVRAVLLPSVMTLLGERNWWAPRWMRWLPSISIEGRRPVATEAR